jgi:UDPglucose 6-dehydrogenase
VNNNILIIGAGKVGTATGIALSNAVDYHDPYKGIINNSFSNYDYIIVCVDTLQTGPNDYADLEGVLSEINDSKYLGTVVIRSTVSPVRVPIWDSAYGFSFILFPEFMSQRDNALVVDKTWIVVLGGDESVNLKFKSEVLEKFGYPFKQEVFMSVSKQEAALIKLADNAALSAKLIYFNSIYAICRMLDLDYENIRKAIGLDSRINGEHSTVPSPDDGKLGFGGHCLPKDLLAIAELDQLGFFDKIKEINSMLR